MENKQLAKETTRGAFKTKLEEINKANFEAKLKDIDKANNSSEIEYCDLTLEAFKKTFENIKNDSSESISGKTDFYWLGNRRGILSDACKELRDECKKLRTEEKRIEKINNELEKILNNYSNNLENFVISKQNKFKGYTENNGHFYHGSTNCEIKEFQPKKNSSGDREELVYFAYSRAYALSYIFEKRGLTHMAKPGGKNAFYRGHSLEDLIEHDIGGVLYEFESGEVQLSVNKAKDFSEVVSEKSVKVEEKNKNKIISALNELLLNDEGFKVYYSGYDKANKTFIDKELTKEDLIKARKNCIDTKIKDIKIRHKKIMQLLGKNEDQETVKQAIIELNDKIRKKEKIEHEEELNILIAEQDNDLKIIERLKKQQHDLIKKLEIKYNKIINKRWKYIEQDVKALAGQKSNNWTNSLLEKISKKQIDLEEAKILEEPELIRALKKQHNDLKLIKKLKEQQRGFENEVNTILKEKFKQKSNVEKLRETRKDIRQRL